MYYWLFVIRYYHPFYGQKRSLIKLHLLMGRTNCDPGDLVARAKPQYLQIGKRDSFRYPRVQIGFLVVSIEKSQLHS